MSRHRLAELYNERGELIFLVENYYKSETVEQDYDQANRAIFRRRIYSELAMTLTENRYDDLGNLIEKIQYANDLSQEDYDFLLANNTIEMPVGEKDRRVLFFYNEANLLIAQEERLMINPIYQDGACNLAFEEGYEINYVYQTPAVNQTVVIRYYDRLGNEIQHVDDNNGAAANAAALFAPPILEDDDSDVPPLEEASTGFQFGGRLEDVD